MELGSSSLFARLTARLDAAIRSIAGRSRQPRKLQTQLVALALAVATPIGGFCGFVVWQLANQESLRHEEELRQTALTAANHIDRQLDATKVTLRVLAGSQHIRDRNWETFHRRAREALFGRDSWVILVDLTGQQIVNSVAPFGTTLPEIADKETLRRVMETRDVVVGNLVTGSVSARNVVNVAYPVFDGEELTHVLYYVLTAELLQTILVDENPPQGWVTGLTDANARVIARSELHAKFVNTRLPEDLANRRSGSGVFEAQRLDGGTVLRSVAQLKNADWYAAATVEKALVTAATRRALATIMILGLILLSLSFMGASLFGRTLAHEIATLEDAGKRLGKDLPVLPWLGRVSEINTVHKALTNAAVERQISQANTARLASIATAALEALVGIGHGGKIETWNRAAQQLFGYAAHEVVGRHVTMLLPEAIRSAHTEQMRKVLAGETIPHFDSNRRHQDGTIVPVSVSMAPIIDASGRIVGLVEAAHDISERHEAERRQMLLRRELAHRVKNTLAVLQAIMRSTLRSSPEPAAFAEAFSGRLMSMAAAQDILTVANWNGAALETLARQQLAAHIDRNSPRISLAGCEVSLAATMAVPLGLALHELGTNAAKYGALSVPDGRVDLSWTVTRDDDEPMLNLVWRESGGPKVEGPQRQGFGGTLIERGIPGASVEQRFDPDGLVCTMQIPLADPNSGDPTDPTGIDA